MINIRPPRYAFGSFGFHNTALCLLAAFCMVDALAQEPQSANPSPDLFAPADPLNPRLPRVQSPDESSTPLDPSAAPSKTGGTKIGNGRTEITADEANFEPETHMAVFQRNVTLKDPDFNVVCDKLVAYLKHDPEPQPGMKKAQPTPAVAAKPKGKAGGADDPHRTLDKAVAEMNPGGRLEITQDKVETDGSVTHSIGHGSKAVYNAITGTTVLTGMPDATKGTDRVVATDEKTVITLLRDGGMSTVGPHKVTIISTSQPGPKTAPQPQ